MHRQLGLIARLLTEADALVLVRSRRFVPRVTRGVVKNGHSCGLQRHGPVEYLRALEMLKASG
jgi:hypothetical protein